ncbi:MAG: hypothetical protein DRN26_00420 [Thermoplasmata archaeon]|nr:MAG: hypothetical protein DRN26_00420 [Thermoplasmata archaeon]
MKSRKLTEKIIHGLIAFSILIAMVICLPSRSVEGTPASGYTCEQLFDVSTRAAIDAVKEQRGKIFHPSASVSIKLLDTRAQTSLRKCLQGKDSRYPAILMDLFLWSKNLITKTTPNGKQLTKVVCLQKHMRMLIWGRRASNGKIMIEIEETQTVGSVTIVDCLPFSGNSR